MPNYAYLKTDIINTTENDSAEFENQIPFLIEKAEIRLTKDLDDVGLTEFSSFSFTASNPVVSLPADTRVIRSVNYKTSVSSNITTLLQRPYEYAIDYFPHASDQVLVFSTDTEINDDLHNMLKPDVSKEYLIEYSGTTNSSTFNSGYFEKEKECV